MGKEKIANIEFSTDTISAISTPAGSGGISIIRISGNEAFDIASKVFVSKKSLHSQEANSVQFGKIIDEDKIIDEVLITKFCSPHSYTGEDVVEVSCHGNPFIANKILSLFLRKSRLARAGEFTQRAFINQKMDLTKVEAVSDILQAKTERSHELAIASFEGKLYRRIVKILKEITHLRILLELEIDFMEQGLSEFDSDLFLKKLQKIINNVQNLIATGEDGMIIREGYIISLIGKPNVGKSSIFNSLLETQRAIVSDIPGTTRDYLEESYSLNGFLIQLNDTAGMRKPENEIEKIGIERSSYLLKKSHLVLYIFDSVLEEFQADSEVKFLKVLNKSDKFSATTLEKAREDGFVICSTITQNGTKELQEAIIQQLNFPSQEINSGILVNTRQISAASKCLDNLFKAETSFNDDLGFEFTAFDLSLASDFLEEIIGKISSEDILHEIFSNFCIGK